MEDTIVGDNPKCSQGSVHTMASDMAEEKSLERHVIKRLQTAMSLASDSEDEPGMADKLSSRNSAPSFEDLKSNTVSACHEIKSVVLVAVRLAL